MMVPSIYKSSNAALLLLWLASAKTTAGHKSQHHHQLAKQRLLSKARALQDSPLTIDAYDHLLEIVVDANGDPNPRITFTEGFKHAADYVAGQMEQMGLIPLGDLLEEGANTKGSRSYFQTVAGSVDEALCPGGMTNVLGMVEGTDFPDQYVVYSAHLDGTINKNPQTRFERGTQHTDNAYDDGFAVAVGLSIAKQMLANPPAPSVIFLIEFHEEVWLKLEEYCEMRRNTEWMKTVFRNSGLPPAPEDECPQWGMGVSKWMNTPVIDFANVKLIVFVDPLGSAYNISSSFLAAIGGEYVAISNTTTNSTNSSMESTINLNSFLDEVWPAESSVELMKVAGGSLADTGYGGSEGVVTRDYRTLCGESCLDTGGLPAIWLAEPAFQRYHGGEGIHLARDLFRGLSENGYEDLLGNATFPSPIYFTLDSIETFYRPNVDEIVTTLSQFMTNTANRVGSYQIQFDEERYQNVVLEESDVQNIIFNLEYMLTVMDEILPAAVGEPLTEIVSTLSSQAKLLIMLDVSDPAIQANATLLGQAVVALALSMDFFNPYYPGQEPFEDQSYAASEGPVEETTNGESESAGTLFYSLFSLWMTTVAAFTFAAYLGT